MATWPGWEIQFLQAAGILNTPPNQRFLTNWASHAQAPSCRDNPIDLSRPVGNSSNCVQPAGFTFWIQRYTSHGQAATAFSREIHSGFASPLLSALRSGNPFQVADFGRVAEALVTWGSRDFADWYLAQFQGGGGGGGGGGPLAPSTHKAWGDLQRSINKVVPHAVRDSRSLRRQTLRDIGRARKVGR